MAKCFRGATGRLPTAGVPRSHRRPWRDPSPQDFGRLLRVPQPGALTSFTDGRCTRTKAGTGAGTGQGGRTARGGRASPSLRARYRVTRRWARLGRSPCTRELPGAEPQCEQATGRRLRSLVIDDFTPPQAAASSTQTGFQEQVGLTPLSAQERPNSRPGDAAPGTSPESGAIPAL